jgi:hypothetical protein
VILRAETPTTYKTALADLKEVLIPYRHPETTGAGYGYHLFGIPRTRTRPRPAPPPDT